MTLLILNFKIILTVIAVQDVVTEVDSLQNGLEERVGSFTESPILNSASDDISSSTISFPLVGTNERSASHVQRENGFSSSTAPINSKLKFIFSRKSIIKTLFFLFDLFFLFLLSTCIVRRRRVTFKEGNSIEQRIIHTCWKS